MVPNSYSFLEDETEDNTFINMERLLAEPTSERSERGDYSLLWGKSPTSTIS